jgi:peptidoglycan lytic transglycosylase
MSHKTGWILIATLLLAACSSAPTRTGGGYLQGDGPGTEDAARLAAVPDAVPRAEPLHPYANRPYEALGVRYVPLTTVGTYKERGIASWYGKKFHGQRTSDGETYDMYGMTAAHKTLPIPSYARVTNLGNGRSVIVRVNDRGPFMHGRIIDVSYAAAYRLGMLGRGSTEVEVESLVPERNAPAAPTVVAAPVQTEPLHAKPIQAAAAVPAGTVYLQLGAFRSAESAQSFLAHMRDELGDLGKQVVLYAQDGLTRVHLGPYRSADEARASAERLAPRLGFKPFVSLH